MVSLKAYQRNVRTVEDWTVVVLLTHFYAPHDIVIEPARTRSMALKD
jgi:hypothetical protein